MYPGIWCWNIDIIERRDRNQFSCTTGTWICDCAEFAYANKLVTHLGLTCLSASFPDCGRNQKPLFSPTSTLVSQSITSIHQLSHTHWRQVIGVLIKRTNCLSSWIAERTRYNAEDDEGHTLHGDVFNYCRNAVIRLLPRDNTHPDFPSDKVDLLSRKLPAESLQLAKMPHTTDVAADSTAKIPFAQRLTRKTAAAILLFYLTADKQLSSLFLPKKFRQVHGVGKTADWQLTNPWVHNI